MSTRKRNLLFLSLVFVALTVGAAVADTLESPTAFVRSLYSHYPLRDDEAGIAFDRHLAKWFTKPLLGALIRDRMIAEKTHTLGLDWDPLCDCQDDDGLRLEAVTVDAQTINSARVTARIWLPGVGVQNEGAVYLSLCRVSGAWRIADLGSPTRPSLARYLAN